MNEQIIQRIAEEACHAGEDARTIELLSRLEQRRITPDTELPPMEFLFQLFGKPCFPRGELVAMTGRPKSGKTFVTSMLMALCHKDEVLGIKRNSQVPLTVLWYDTEQSDLSTQDILRNRIIPMIGDFNDNDNLNHNPNPNDNHSMRSLPLALHGRGLGRGYSGGSSFHTFNVRQEMWRDRMPLLEVAIRQYQPDFVVVDGIRDLVNDINDGELAQEVVEGLMHLASEQRCCILCVLHQNKSAEDSNLRGWIGTELTHKAFEVYECQKDADSHIFSLKQKLTRKYDIMDELRYVVDDDGIPRVACIEHLLNAEQKQRIAERGRPELSPQYILEWNDKQPVFDLPTLYMDAIPECGVSIHARDLQEKVMTLANMTSVFLYNKVRESAMKADIIKMAHDQNGHVVYYRPKTEIIKPTTNTDHVPQQTELPFSGGDDAPF